jgi:hypothetical protein
MKLWKYVQGEPYMINPRLGVLALQALNPHARRKESHTMPTRSAMARHMAWVRGHKTNAKARRNPRHYYHRRHRRNPYPMAGTVAALNPHRRHYRHNPVANPRRPRHYRRNPAEISQGRQMFGLPPIQPVLWATAGFAATAMVQGFVDTLVPASMKTNPDGTPSLMVKYFEIAASIIGVTMLGKQFLGRGQAALLGIGGGVYAAGQIVHDLLPNVIPGMHAYTPLRSYTPLRGVGRSIPYVGRSMPHLAQYNTAASMPQLAAPSHGALNDAYFAADGAMNVAASRFRRFA